MHSKYVCRSGKKSENLLSLFYFHTFFHSLCPQMDFFVFSSRFSFVVSVKSEKERNETSSQSTTNSLSKKKSKPYLITDETLFYENFKKTAPTSSSFSSLHKTRQSSNTEHGSSFRPRWINHPSFHRNSSNSATTNFLWLK